jgi:1-acyl-sn-glycerol-3-phosphate acyltransferase
MDILAQIRKPARATAFLALTAASVAVCEAHRARVPEDQRDAIYHRHVHPFVRRLMRLFRVDMRVLHDPPKQTTNARLIIANHRSALDIAILLDVFEARIVSRADLSMWPVLGRAARLGGTIFVDRDEGGSRATALRAIRSQLQKGYTVGVFAEGATFEGDEVREFNAGAFLAARGLHVDIVPVGLAYERGTEFVGESFVAHLGKIASRKGTTVVVNVGKPIAVRNGARELAAELRERVQVLVDEARVELSRSR